MLQVELVRRKGSSYTLLHHFNLNSRPRLTKHQFSFTYIEKLIAQSVMMQEAHKYNIKIKFYHRNHLLLFISCSY